MYLQTIFSQPLFMVFRMISVELILFYWSKLQYNQWCQEDLIQKAVYQTEIPRIAVHWFLKKVAGIHFCKSPILKYFTGISMCERIFSVVKKVSKFPPLRHVKNRAWYWIEIFSKCFWSCWTTSAMINMVKNQVKVPKKVINIVKGGGAGKFLRWNTSGAGKKS